MDPKSYEQGYLDALSDVVAEMNALDDQTEMHDVREFLTRMLRQAV